jgi:hypothetical protein
MGLDVVAYNGIEKVDPELHGGKLDFNTDDIWELCDEHGWFIPSTCGFEEHGKGVEDTPYTSEGEISFRAGSYGSYNGWRNSLAVFAGYGSAQDVWEMDHPWGTPFIELINFSDCEGVIGPDLCKKLSEDFTSKRKDAIVFALEHNDDWFMRTYDDFMEALTFASDRGILVFC